MIKANAFIVGEGASGEYVTYLNPLHIVRVDPQETRHRVAVHMTDGRTIYVGGGNSDAKTIALLLADEVKMAIRGGRS